MSIMTLRRSLESWWRQSRRTDTGGGAGVKRRSLDTGCESNNLRSGTQSLPHPLVGIRGLGGATSHVHL